VNDAVLSLVGLQSHRSDDLTRLLDCSPEFLDLLPVAMCACGADGRLIWFNSRAADLWGRRPRIGSDADLYCGAHKRTFGGRQIGRQESPTAQALRSGEPVRALEGMFERPDGSTVGVTVHVAPVQDRRGKIVGAINCFHETSELDRERDRDAERERTAREILEALPAAIYTTDADGRITFYNEAATKLWGCRPQLGSSRFCGSWRLYSTDGRPMRHEDCPMAVALRENRPIRGAEAIAERPDGTRVPFIPYPTPLRDASGRLVGAVNMLVDITERKRAEDRQNVLVAELNHRVKNALATVQSLACQTLRGAGIPPQVREAFDRRLFALSSAHDQLSRAGWETGDLRATLHDALAPYEVGSTDRIQLRGEEVKLSPKATLTLAMVAHELATNAAKYGALSVPAGSVTVSWTVETVEGGRRLSIVWVESGGPPVTDPGRSGFGRRFMERGIAAELRGSAAITFEPGGVQIRITIPLRHRGGA
jgi:PAS domain S-box-containing protein